MSGQSADVEAAARALDPILYPHLNPLVGRDWATTLKTIAADLLATDWFTTRLVSLEIQEGAAKVLAEHEIETPRGYAFTVCSCGTEFGNEGTGTAHVAAVVLAWLAKEVRP